MKRAIETASQEANGWRMYVLAAYYLLFGNFALTVAFLGAVLIGVGRVLQWIGSTQGLEGNVPVMAGMLGIWGITLVLFGIVGYGIFWANSKYAEITASSARS